MKQLLLLAIALVLLLAPYPAHTQITIDTSNSSDWKIRNGVISVDWLPGDGRIFSIHWSAFPNEEIIDQTNRDSHGPKGFYMDNAGNISGGTATNSYYMDPNGKYIDWWNTIASNSTNAFTWSQHHILFANDPGIHIYFTLDHSSNDIAGSVGQVQWVFRSDLNQFVNTYSVNTGLGNLGATTVPIPSVVLFGGLPPGLPAGTNVQDATNDLHGCGTPADSTCLALPADYRREFYTKYDYSSYEYLHQAEGVYGSSLAAWMVVPSSESLTGGPTKQDLIFTGNLLIMEAFSNHLDNQITFMVPEGTAMHKLYGPFYLHFNTYSPTNPTAASLYLEGLASAQQLQPSYDGEAELLNSGYVPSMARGEVHASIEGTKGLDLNQAWAVLSDNLTNVQYSHAGNQYWVNMNPGGIANFHNVAPGTYRLSVYALGQWGELRRDGITVSANQTTKVSASLLEENFGSDAPIWTIGTADRSSHEFLHGQIKNPIDLDPNYSDEYTARLGNSVQDDREYWGNWNYWADFASTSGAVVYNATDGPNGAATNDLTKWNYNQWQIFDPGLYAAPYNSSDTTKTDGYTFIIPSYVESLPGASGTNGVTTKVPDWQVHFTTSADQQGQGQYVVLSVGLAATEASMTVSLNGNPIVWHGFNLKNADAGVRSGFSGTYQWVVFQWNKSQLNPPGQDNVITFNVNRAQGVMYDALRMEITNKSADQTATGWNDYEFLYGNTYEPANDGMPNQ